MSDKELRELDAWIADEVFKRWMLNPEGLGDAPKYTTDPAVALGVLKKCAEKLCDDKAFSDALMIQPNEAGNGWFVGPFSDDTKCVESPTLELAICLFAKKLFTKC